MNIPAISNIVSAGDPGRAGVANRYLLNLLEEGQKLPLQVVEAETVSWLQDIREKASTLVSKLQFPNNKDEEWRFTNLTSLQEVNFKINLESLEPKTINFPETNQSKICFVNGIFTPESSDLAALPEGVFVGNLTQLPIQYDTRIRNYLAQQTGLQDVFSLLNTAGLIDTAIVWISKDVVVDTPIHLLFASIGEETLSQPRCLVVAETGSNVTLIEDYTSTNEGVYLTNSVTEIWVEENAQVNHNRIQSESEAAFHIGKTAVSQARNSRYSCNAISFGGKLSRHNLEIIQTGEQTETNLNGLTLISGEQVSDTHSAIALNFPYAKTRQIHKCIIDDKAHGVFNGKVFVPKLAQQTDAGQLNQNLLLSNKARIDTKPQLEITADNVKCTHGATVSQLDADEIFYLQSRGLNARDSRKLLVNAFAAEIINQLPIASLRESLTQAVNQKINPS